MRDGHCLKKDPMKPPVVCAKGCGLLVELPICTELCYRKVHRRVVHHCKGSARALGIAVQGLIDAIITKDGMLRNKAHEGSIQ